MKVQSTRVCRSEILTEKWGREQVADVASFCACREVRHRRLVGRVLALLLFSAPATAADPAHAPGVRVAGADATSWSASVCPECDLAVVGGGSGGFGAALAAARLGLQVVLVERADQLGGTSVRSGVTCWEPGVGGTGIPFDLYRRLQQIPKAVGIYSFGRHLVWFNPDAEPYRFPGGETVIDPTRRYADSLRRHGVKGLAADEAACREHLHGVVFEPDAMSATMKAMLEETGRCRILLNTEFRTLRAAAGRVQFLQLANGQRIVARFYVDATGDGRLCHDAGCEAMTGQESRDRFDEPSAPLRATNKVNGVTLIYRVASRSEAGIDPLPPDVPAKCWWRGSFPVAQMNHYPNGDLNVNMLPTMDGQESLQRGEQASYAECRRRVLAHWHDLQTRYEEFRRRRITWIAPALGVRETRRFVGEYVLTERDVRGGLSQQKHPDVIAIADHSLDTHGSHAHGSGELREPYGVPYRCLIPKGYRNLLIACRAASFSSLAASSCRLSRTMIQLGQAAGTAAALAAQRNVDLSELPPETLRDALRAQHVQLEHPLREELRQRLSTARRTLDGIHGMWSL
ncbi:MAG: FAD-dependent oxidoreductase [Candidatus Anammoximicrobium sp.]|nr:FAD-dependent oxidoreductase [Candidatus Anammoximicrobium sp.]